MAAQKKRQAPEAGLDIDLPPSRSAKKRESAALQKLGETLISLSPAARAEMDLPSDLMEALALHDQIRDREGARRQRQFIGKLMRSVDAEAIETRLQRLSDVKTSQLVRFKKAERLRDELLGLPQTDIAQRASQLLAGAAYGISAGSLANLIRDAQAEKEGRKNTGKGRELFRVLNSLLKN